MEKTKMLYLITKDDIGGAQKYVYDLATNLDKEKFEAKILTGGPSTHSINSGSPRETRGATSSGQAKIHFLSNSFHPYFLFINDWLAVAELFFILRREKPNVLHLNSSKAGVIGALAAFLYNASNKLINSSTHQLKTIFTAHGWVFNPDNDLGWLRRQFYIFLHKIAARFQNKIINVSEYDRRLAIKYRIASPEKLITIHNGIDYQNIKFLDKQAARKALIKLINSSTHQLINSIWVGSIGRLVKEKNYETFIKAAALIENQQLKFFIIGDGPEKENLEFRIQNLGLQNKFFLIENLAPAAQYLKAFDIFILSSIKEGLPYTLLEAMAGELPIIATRVGGIPEVLNPSAQIKRGIVMPPKEPEELARAISYLLETPEQAKYLALQARQAFKVDLDLERMIDKTIALYIGP